MYKKWDDYLLTSWIRVLSADTAVESMHCAPPLSLREKVSYLLLFSKALLNDLLPHRWELAELVTKYFYD